MLVGRGVAEQDHPVVAAEMTYRLFCQVVARVPIGHSQPGLSFAVAWCECILCRDDRPAAAAAVGVRFVHLRRADGVRRDQPKKRLRKDGEKRVVQKDVLVAAARIEKQGRQRRKNGKDGRARL